MTPFILGLVLLVLAGAGCVVLGANSRVGEHWYRVLTGAGCALLVVPAMRVLGGGTIDEVRLHAGVPGGPWVFGIDALSALFLLIIAAVGAAAAYYGATYLRGHRRGPLAHLLLTLLIGELALVVVARAAMPFLVAWESMAVTAYLLIVFDHEQPEVRRAGLLYLVATHTGTLALLLMFAVWGNGATDLTFASLAAGRLPGEVAPAAVLMLALVGFGLKAGVVPLHVWLPPAHAAAPSHVSAFLSGVVIKMGIYGLFRVVALLDSIPAWWGWLLLASGALSGVLGVLWALAQHDLKRLLAFHSVENIGIILLGLGAGVLGLANDSPVVAQLGFASAALHTVNHALFKSLLFMGAGSVYQATHTREIDQLGGLARWMPRTAALFLIGSAAIVGLPPLNGFVSEWLLFRSFMHAGLEAGGLRVAVLAGPVLGLSGALALACFAKVVGMIYLGTPRGTAETGGSESPSGLMHPQIALAAGCAVIGLVPAAVLAPIMGVSASVARIRGGATAGLAAAGTLTVLALVIVAALAAGRAWSGSTTRRRGLSRGMTWACGIARGTPRMQYTASSFAAPLLAAYQPVAGVVTRREADRHETHAVDPVLAMVLQPAWVRVRSLADRIRPIQRGRLSVYLIYIVLTLVALLFYLLAMVG